MGYLITVSEKSVKDDDSVNFKKSPMMPIFTNRLMMMKMIVIMMLMKVAMMICHYKITADTIKSHYGHPGFNDK